eukprot:3263832-Pyramimonas_sp.AAC.1
MPPGSFVGQPRKPSGSRRVSAQVPCSVAACWPSAVERRTQWPGRKPMPRMCRSLISRTSAMCSKPCSAKLDAYIPGPC